MDTVTESAPTQQLAESVAQGLPRLLTVKQVAQLSGYSTGTVYNMICNGTLPSVKYGTNKQGRVTVPEDGYLAWYKSLNIRNPVKTRNYNRRRKAA